MASLIERHPYVLGREVSWPPYQTMRLTLLEMLLVEQGPSSQTQRRFFESLSRRYGAKGHARIRISFRANLMYRGYKRLQEFMTEPHKQLEAADATARRVLQSVGRNRTVLRLDVHLPGALRIFANSWRDALCGVGRFSLSSQRPQHP